MNKKKTEQYQLARSTPSNNNKKSIFHALINIHRFTHFKQTTSQMRCVCSRENSPIFIDVYYYCKMKLERNAKIWFLLLFGSIVDMILCW